MFRPTFANPSVVQVWLNPLCPLNCLYHDMLEQQHFRERCHSSHLFGCAEQKEVPKYRRNYLPGKRVQDECHHWESSLHCCKTENLPNKSKDSNTISGEYKCTSNIDHTDSHRNITTYVIAEDLVQWPTSLHQTVHSSQPQAQKAVVDALHQHNLTHNEDRVPDVATKVTGHCGVMFHVQAQRMLTAGPNRYQLAHPVWPVCDLKLWNKPSYILSIYFTAWVLNLSPTALWYRNMASCIAVRYFCYKQLSLYQHRWKKKYRIKSKGAPNVSVAWVEVFEKHKKVMLGLELTSSSVKKKAVQCNKLYYLEIVVWHLNQFVLLVCAEHLIGSIRTKKGPYWPSPYWVNYYY